MRTLVHSSRVEIMRTLARLAVILLAYGGVFLMYFLLRTYPLIPHPTPFSPAELFPIGFNQKVIGFTLQITIVPLLLILLLSYLPYFRRLLQDQTAPHATPGVLLGLTAIQLVSQAYEIWVARSMGQPFLTGTFVIIVGSLIGGWRIGLLLGTVSLVFQNVFELSTMSTIFTDLRIMGVWKYFSTHDVTRFFLTTVVNPHFSNSLWMAVFACLGADWLGPRRYSPLAASALGMILTYAVEYLRLAGGVVPTVEGLPAQALVTGFAVAWVMLMIRTLQVEAEHRKTADAELSRMQAELRALRAQINPHFFFNALNTIRYMIRENPQKARDLLIDLSEIFQRTLRSGDFVPLRDELGYVAAYLSLEKARLDDRLRIVWGGVLRPDAPLETESPLLDFFLPTLALQPIVENAVIHGIGKKKEGGTVSVSVESHNDDLVIEIEDDGTGMDADQQAALLQPGDRKKSGIGVKNVDARLRMLYGPEYGMVIDSEVDKGTCVTIRVPVGKGGKK